MKVAIIGAGFTGLAAAIDVAGQGHEVQVFEKDALPGGLAIGFTSSGWDWSLEKHYHHIFTSDHAIRRLSAIVGHPIHFIRPKTSILYQQDIKPFDSPISLLKYPYLSLMDKIRTAAGIGFLIINPFWKPLEYLTSEKFIRFVMGKNSWEVLWRPLFIGKFGDYMPQISAAWFWARIHKRSPALGYPERGFTALAKSMANYAARLGVKFTYSVGVKQIKSAGSGIVLSLDNNRHLKFDKVICTLATPLFSKITQGLPSDYVSRLQSLHGIGAVNLVLSLKKSLLTDGTYWLNINDRQHPYLAVVEHTNFIPKSRYSNENLVYVGNYLPIDHKYFAYTKEKLISEYSPYLKKINPHFNKSWIKSAWIWSAPFAQPIVTLKYSQKLPALTTPIPNLYLANIQQVYPWDRGTNYAVELGQKVARLCLQD